MDVAVSYFCRIFTTMKLKSRLVFTGIVLCIFLLVLIPTYLEYTAGIGAPSSFYKYDRSLDNAPHLQLLRKDLDLSNYTSEGHGSRNVLPLQRPVVSLSNKTTLDSEEALSFIKTNLLTDRDFLKKTNLDRLLLAATVIKKHDKERLRNKEFLPGELDENLKDTGRKEKEEENDRKQHAHEDIDSAQGDIDFDKLVIKNNSKSSAFSLRHDANIVLREDELKILMGVTTSRKGPPVVGGRLGGKLELFDENNSSNLALWQKFQSHITQFHLYEKNSRDVNNLLEAMATDTINDCIMKSGGTQLKLTFYFDDEMRAIFKPMRFSRSVETWPNHFYFSDFERHTAEIAAYHLDRVLDFRRVPPVAGRLVNITRDIKRFAQAELLKTIFVSPAGNVCFHGKCDYYCDTGHAFCGNPEMIEGSMASYLPTGVKVKRKTWRHPWRRSYHKRRKADWEKNNSYCDNVRTKPPYNSGRRLLDIMDMAVFDFLQGNLDRHHYETIVPFGNYTFPIHLDNGRGFGHSNIDELSCLAPIYQCCLLRYSTLQKILAFERGPVSLSEAMRKSLSKDHVHRINPILTEPHMKALDRRVKIILKTVAKCLQKNRSFHRVIKDDGF